MKPSEAIRKGAPIVTEITEDYLHMGRKHPCGCALGTAYVALGGKPPDEAGYLSANKIRPFLLSDSDEWDLEIRHPLTALKEPLFDVVNSLHMYGDLSRAKIASWLESEGH